MKLATRFLPPKEAEAIVRLITEFSLIPDEHRFTYYAVQHISGLYVKEYKEDGDDIKIVFTKSKLSAANKLTATDREKIMEYKLGDTPVEDREESYYRIWIPVLSKEHKVYIHGTSSDSAVIAFTNDKNLADKVSERGAKAVVLLMDRIHNIKVEKERVR